MPKVWSCLQNGLLSMSGSEFQANGAAFGDGIYLSTEESVALNFAPRFAVTKRLSRLWGENGGETHNRMFAEAAKTCDGLMFVFDVEDGTLLRKVDLKAKIYFTMTLTVP